MCLSLSAGGCSFALVDGPPIGHEQLEYVLCTETTTFPVLDVIGVAGSLLDADRAEAWALAVVFGASAWTGFRRVNACRAARLESALRSPPAPDPLASAADQVRWPAPTLACGPSTWWRRRGELARARRGLLTTLGPGGAFKCDAYAYAYVARRISAVPRWE